VELQPFKILWVLLQTSVRPSQLRYFRTYDRCLRLSTPSNSKSGFSGMYHDYDEIEISEVIVRFIVPGEWNVHMCR
jgi:hypothetical protein